MQSENRLFDDFVKVLNGAAGTFAGMGRAQGRAGRLIHNFVAAQPRPPLHSGEGRCTIRPWERAWEAE